MGEVRESREEPKEGDYQLFCVKLKFLRCCNNAAGFLVIASIFVLGATFVSGGIMNINASSLERRFGLSSTQSGLVVIGYDIAFCVCSLFVTYFGGHANRPRLVAIGSAVAGLGCLIYSVPHFATGKYIYGNSQLLPWCISPAMNLGNLTTCTQSEDLTRFTGVLLLGSLLMGAGVTPAFTLGISFLEESVSKRASSLYLGIYNSAAIFGPVVGFLVGAEFFKYYFVDYDTVPQSEHNLTLFDPRWVGAWWVGPLMGMAVCWITFIPLLGFPRQLPGTNKHRAERESEVHATGGGKYANQEDFGKSVKDFPRSVWILLRNPTFTLVTIASVCQALIVNGVSAFITKFLENEFFLDIGTASTYAGAILVPAGAVGHIIAGLIIYFGKLKTPGILKLSAASLILVCLINPLSFLHCWSADIAGVTKPYALTELQVGNLSSSCNSKCQLKCQEEFFIPVCGEDGITYFSPCHAGCYRPIIPTGSRLPVRYENCGCINPNASNPAPTGKATPGACYSTCNTLNAFLASQFFGIMFTFIPITCSIVVQLRVVPDSMRSFGLGVTAVFARAVGTIPGPIIFGAAIDATCRLWQTRQCDQSRGSCWIYDNRQMAIVFVVLIVVVNFIAAIIFFLGFIFYKPEDKKEEYNSDDEVKKSEKNGAKHGKNGRFSPYSVEVVASDNPAYENDRI